MRHRGWSESTKGYSVYLRPVRPGTDREHKVKEREPPSVWAGARWKAFLRDHWGSEMSEKTMPERELLKLLEKALVLLASSDIDQSKQLLIHQLLLRALNEVAEAGNGG